MKILFIIGIIILIIWLFLIISICILYRKYLLKCKRCPYNYRSDCSFKNCNNNYDIIYFEYPFSNCTKKSIIIGSENCENCSNYISEEEDHYGKTYVKCKK